MGRSWGEWGGGRRVNKAEVEGGGTTGELEQELVTWGEEGGGGARGGAVEGVDSGKSAGGEGGSVDCN